MTYAYQVTTPFGDLFYCESEKAMEHMEIFAHNTVKEEITYAWEDHPQFQSRAVELTRNPMVAAAVLAEGYKITAIYGEGREETGYTARRIVLN